jgi:hypothetical protein
MATQALSDKQIATALIHRGVLEAMNASYYLTSAQIVIGESNDPDEGARDRVLELVCALEAAIRRTSDVVMVEIYGEDFADAFFEAATGFIRDQLQGTVAQIISAVAEVDSKVPAMDTPGSWVIPVDDEEE